MRNISKTTFIQKRNHTETKNTSAFPYVLRSSYSINWACMQEKPVPREGKKLEKNQSFTNFLWIKLV